VSRLANSTPSHPCLVGIGRRNRRMWGSVEERYIYIYFILFLSQFQTFAISFLQILYNLSLKSVLGVWIGECSKFLIYRIYSKYRLVSTPLSQMNAWSNRELKLININYFLNFKKKFQEWNFENSFQNWLKQENSMEEKISKICFCFGLFPCKGKKIYLLVCALY